MADLPKWQNDNDVVSCNLCHQPFTWTHRRHHCRKCGRVVCGDCSGQSIKYLPQTLVVTTEGIEQLGSQIYRTCDECVQEIQMITRALQPTPSLQNSMLNGVGVTGSTDTLCKQIATTKTISRNSSIDDVSDMNICPICGVNLTDRYTIEHEQSDFDKFKESHIDKCLTMFDFDLHHQRYNTIHPRNKMLVYIIPPIPTPQYEPINSYDTVKMNMEEGKSDDFIGSVNSTSTIQEKIGDNECVICLEDLKPGDKVGRLECLCIFHYMCIKDWFNRKGYGECPIHYLQK